MKSVFKPVSLIIAMTMIGSISLAQNGNGNGNNRRPDQSRDAWKNDNNNIITTDDFNGNIGVGTDNPIGNIHVFGDYGFQLILESDAPYNPDMSFAESGNNVAQIKYETGDNGLGFYVKDNNTAGYNGFGNSELGIFINGSNRNVGIGTHTPTATLDVNGNFKLVDGSQGQNKVLTSDASGNATWQTISYSNVFSDLYATDYLKVGNSSTYITGSGAFGANSGNTIFTTNGALVLNPTGITAGSVTSTGQNTLINPDNGNVGIGITTPETKLHVQGGPIRVDNYNSNFVWNTWKVGMLTPLGTAWVADKNSNGEHMSIGITETGLYVGISTQDIGAGGSPSIEYPFIVQSNHDVNMKGDVSIGGINPSAKLHITRSIDGTSLIIDHNVTNDYSVAERINVQNDLTKAIQIQNNGNEVFAIWGNGIMNTQKIYATEVQVQPSTANISWPDYVFEQNYDLNSIEELETYLNNYKHLPGVPSAKEVETNGIDLGKMDAILLQKIEELTLYIIAQEKRIKELEK